MTNFYKYLSSGPGLGMMHSFELKIGRDSVKGWNHVVNELDIYGLCNILIVLQHPQ